MKKRKNKYFKVTKRYAVAWFLHKVYGWPYEAIGEVFNVSKQAIHKWLTILTDAGEHEIVDILTTGRGANHDAFTLKQRGEGQPLVDREQYLKWLITERRKDDIAEEIETRWREKDNDRPTK